ncbi:MAG: response regulator [Sandaracinaceae bacterium]|nr:response regulator [Sandaracinaceae bacterium]
MTRPRLFLVDDEEELLWSLTERIRIARPHFDVMTASDGLSALEQLTIDPPDLIVADIRMPRMNGLELVVAARRIRPSLPVVVMTAYPTHDVLEEIQRRGSIEYLEKPFDFERFITVVERALQRADDARVGFSGAILVQTLPDIVQLYALSNATGALHVECRGQSGVVWFERGAIPHALAGPLTGVPAFLEIMSWRGGQFSMEMMAVAPARSIAAPWMELVMEACRQSDERGRDSVESVEKGWTLVPPPPSSPPSEKPRSEDGPRSSSDRRKLKEGIMANIKDSLTKLDSLDGFIGACLCDSESGMVLGTEGGGPSLNLEIAGAANTEVVRAKRKAARSLGLKDDIEDILITLGKQYHLIRPLKGKPSVFFYVALDRGRANLGMARITLADVERDLSL